MIRDSWLADVAPDAPCGPDLQYDQDFLALEAAARGKPEQQYGTTIIPAEEPDWPAPSSKSASALLDRAHDLRVARLLRARPRRTPRACAASPTPSSSRADGSRSTGSRCTHRSSSTASRSPRSACTRSPRSPTATGSCATCGRADFLRSAGLQVTVRDAKKILDPKLGTSDAGVGLDRAARGLADAIAKDTALLPEPARDRRDGHRDPHRAPAAPRAVGAARPGRARRAHEAHRGDWSRRSARR